MYMQPPVMHRFADAPPTTVRRVVREAPPAPVMNNGRTVMRQATRPAPPIYERASMPRQNNIDSATSVRSVKQTKTTISSRGPTVNTWNDIWDVFQTSDGTWFQLAYISFFVMAIRFVNNTISERRNKITNDGRGGESGASLNLLTNAASLHTYITWKATLGVVITMIAFITSYYTYYVWDFTTLVALQSNWFIVVLCLSWLFTITLPAMLSAVYRGEYISWNFASRRWLQMAVILYTSKLRLQYELGFWTYGMLASLWFGLDLLFGARYGMVASDGTHITHDHGAFPRICGLDYIATFMEMVATIHDLYCAIVLAPTIGLIGTLPLLFMNMGILYTQVVVELYNWLGQQIITTQTQTITSTSDGDLIIEKSASVVSTNTPVVNVPLNASTVDTPVLHSTTTTTTNNANPRWLDMDESSTSVSTSTTTTHANLTQPMSFMQAFDPTQTNLRKPFATSTEVVTLPDRAPSFDIADWSLSPDVIRQWEKWIQSGMVNWNTQLINQLEQRVKLATYQWFRKLLIDVIKDESAQFGATIMQNYQAWIKEQPWMNYLINNASPTTVATMPITSAGASLQPTTPMTSYQLTPPSVVENRAFLSSSEAPLNDLFTVPNPDIAYWLKEMANLSEKDRKTIYYAWGSLYNQLKSHADNPTEWNQMTVAQQEQFLTYLKYLYKHVSQMASYLNP